MKLAILLIGGLLVWTGIFYFLFREKDSSEQARAVAEKSLYACVDNPETIKIKTVSKADSVFGHEYVTQDEQMNIAMAMLRINGKVMEATDNMENLDFSDPSTTALMERQMSSLSVLRSLVSFDPEEEGKKKERRRKEEGKKKPFNGWKVKIEYEAKDAAGNPYRSEYWFITDKDATCVVRSFEIPLL